MEQTNGLFFYGSDMMKKLYNFVTGSMKITSGLATSGLAISSLATSGFRRLSGDF